MVRAHGLLVALMLLIVPVYLAWSWSDQLGNLGGDAAMYLMTAAAYSPFAPHSDLFAEIASTSRFPPLYPLLLALTGGAGDLLVAHLVTVATLLAALVALCAWLEICGASRVQAALVVLVTAVLPQTYFLALWPQSEYPYFLFSAIALASLARYRKSPALGSGLIAATAIAAATLTRSIGIALLPAFAATVFVTHRRHIWLLAMAAGPVALWMVLHQAPTNYLHTLSVYGHDTAAQAWTQLSAQPRVLGDGFAANFVDSGGLVFIAKVLGILVALLTLRRLLSLQPDAVYVLGYVAILAIWPFPEESARLLWPIVPVFAAALTIESASVARRASPSMRAIIEVAAPMAMLLLTLPGLAFVADRWTSASDLPDEFRNLKEWYVSDPRKALALTQAHLGTVAQLERLTEIVRPDECVVSVKPELVEYFAGRLSKAPPLNSVPDAQFSAKLRGLGCRYVLMFAANDPVYPVPLHPFARIKDQIDVVDRELIFNVNERYDSLVALLGRLKPAPDGMK